jgi:hypothetical protein
VEEYKAAVLHVFCAPSIGPGLLTSLVLKSVLFGEGSCFPSLLHTHRHIHVHMPMHLPTVGCVYDTTFR